jgi:hypothetical protein
MSYIGIIMDKAIDPTTVPIPAIITGSIKAVSFFME